jgi:hypothetical protein
VGRDNKLPYPAAGVLGAGNNEGILARARERERASENGEELIRIGGKAIGTFGRSRENRGKILQQVLQRDIWNGIMACRAPGDDVTCTAASNVTCSR